MNRILVICATWGEIEAFMAKEEFRQKGDIFCGEYKGKELSVASTGVGPLRSAVEIMRLAAEIEPDLIVQAGFAGCYRLSELSVGDNVVVSHEREADLGIFTPEGFNPLWKIDFGQDSLTGRNGFMACPEAELIRASGMREVKSNTVCCAGADFIPSDDAEIENMEGAALFRVGLRQHIPFVELRTVSNAVGDRQSWNIALARERVADSLTRFLKTL